MVPRPFQTSQKSRHDGWRKSGDSIEQETAMHENPRQPTVGLDQLPARSAHDVPAVRRDGALAIGAAAVGALALGALAIGAMTIGRLAVGRLAMGRANLRSGRVGELRITQLIIDEISIGRVRRQP
jgi:hypothetical protein